MKKLFIYLQIFFFSLILFPSLSATTSGNTYSVGSSVFSLQGGNATGNIYQATTYLTTNTGGEANSSLYQGIIGFFGKFKRTIPVIYTVTINQTETVQAGNVYSLTIEIINSSGDVEITSAPKITLHDSLKNLIVDSVSATLLSDKKYQYNFTTNLVDVAGIKETNISIGINGITKQYNSTWTLSNGRTAVAINIVNVVSSPTISANVTITNEDALAYEYPYEYCIVSVFTQQCGNSGNVASGSGYKLLNPGESWNPILSLNIVQSGNYWFKIVADYGTQSSGATRSFSATYTPAGSSGTGGSSGGGGSSSSATTTSFDADFTARSTVTFNAGQGISKTFTFDGTTSHSIKVESLIGNAVMFTISSNPITITMNVGEIKEVDINGDGLNDIKINLKKINNEVIEYTIEKLERGVAAITGQTIEYPKHLMDISTKILDDYKFINAGDKIFMELSLYNLGTEEIKDAKIRYCIETDNKETVKCSEEVVAIYTKIQLVKEFLISENTNPGKYFIKTEATYGNETVFSETSFEVSGKTQGIEKEIKFNQWLLIIIIIITILIIIIYTKKNKSSKQKFGELPLKVKLRQLEELKSRRALSKKSYLKERTNLLARFGEAVINNKKVFVYFMFTSLVIVILTMLYKTNITGMTINNLLSHDNKNLWVSLVMIFIFALLIILRKKVYYYLRKIKESMNYSSNKSKKYPSNNILGLINKKVYSEGGHYIGKIGGIILEKNKIESLEIKIDKKHEFKTKGIVINYEHTKNVGEIIIIDEKIYEELKKSTSHKI